MVALVEKAKNAGISLYPGEIERLKTRASIRDGGSPTRYFRRLFEADEKGEPIASNYEQDIIAKLATIYAGYFAPQMSASLAERKIDQPRLLHKLLQELQESFACGASTPEEIVVVPRSELRQDHPWFRQAPFMHAAEDKSPYSAPKSGAVATPQTAHKSDFARPIAPVPKPRATG